MKNIFVFISLLFICGCVTTKPMVLTDSERYYLIPANTPFTAVVEDGGKVQSVQRTSASYVVDAGFLVTLQEKANACVLNNR